MVSKDLLSNVHPRDRIIKILRFFLDVKSARFSLANFMLLKQAGDWLGPTSAATTIQALA